MFLLDYEIDEKLEMLKKTAQQYWNNPPLLFAINEQYKYLESLKSN